MRWRGHVITCRRLTGERRQDSCKQVLSKGCLSYIYLFVYFFLFIYLFIYLFACLFEKRNKQNVLCQMHSLCNRSRYFHPKKAEVCNFLSIHWFHHYSVFPVWPRHRLYRLLQGRFEGRNSWNLGQLLSVPNPFWSPWVWRSAVCTGNRSMRKLRNCCPGW